MDTSDLVESDLPLPSIPSRGIVILPESLLLLLCKVGDKLCGVG